MGAEAKRFAVIDGALWEFRAKEWLRFLYYYSIAPNTRPEYYGDRVARVDVVVSQVTNPQDWALRQLALECDEMPTEPLRRAATEVAALARRDHQGTIDEVI